MFLSSQILCAEIAICLYFKLNNSSLCVNRAKTQYVFVAMFTNKAAMLSNKMILFTFKTILFTFKMILFTNKTAMLYVFMALLSNKMILFTNKTILFTFKMILFTNKTVLFTFKMILFTNIAPLLVNFLLKTYCVFSKLPIKSKRLYIEVREKEGSNPRKELRMES